MFSIVTSAFFRSSRTISSPRGAFRLTVSDFLLALNWWKYQGSLSGAPGPASRRPGSPTPGFSIFTTSAPSQASDSVQDGPASNWVKSTTLMPARQSSSTPKFVMSAPPREIDDRVAPPGTRCQFFSPLAGARRRRRGRPVLSDRRSRESAKKRKRLRDQPVSRSARQPIEPLLDELDEEARPIRQGGIVEIVAGVVHLARPLAVAVADLDIGAGDRAQHVGEVLRR